MMRRSVLTACAVAVVVLVGPPADAGQQPSGRADIVVPIAEDMAVPSGLAQTSTTFDAFVNDYNRDGWSDVAIGHHGTGPLQLFVNQQNGTFVEPNPGLFPSADRHDCATADANGDGLIDIACAHGADHGVGMKSN